MCSARRLLVAVLLALPALAACGDPCSDLANKICDCEPGRAARERCRTTLRSVGEHESTNGAERSACGDFVDTCTCEAVARRDAAACGFVATLAR